MEEKQEGLNEPSKGSTDDKEKTQAHTGSKVREGQENSSILHDKKDPDNEIQDVTKKDISSTSQEEFIDDDANTKKSDE
ncbi:MAG: hypothetical protein ABIN89_29605 [Chitinophagaceae bacterium]